MRKNIILALLAGVVLGAAGFAALGTALEGIGEGREQDHETAGKHAVLPAGAPAPIGPYTPAIRSGDFLFLSGQIGLDPGTGAMVEGGIAGETARVMTNLGVLLEAAGLGFEDAVRTTVYLADLDDYAAFNEEYAKSFGEVPPARVTVQVARLPRDARVEISMIAIGAPH